MEIKRILIASSLFILTLLTLLHTGLYPTVFADEWLYSSSARLFPITASLTPSYFYLLLFKQTNVCGAQFLECARLMNAGFFAASLPFIYLIARRVMSARIALWVAGLSLLSPMTSYASYFMPESMYFFAFYVLAWFVLTCAETRWVLLSVGAGLLLSVMSLIKMHALFLVPAIVIYLIGMPYWCGTRTSKRQILLALSYFLLTFFSVRWLLGYLIAGEQGFNIIGLKYSANMAQVMNNVHVQHSISLLRLPLVGHLTAITVLLSIPIVVSVHARLQRISVFALACLVMLVGVTVYTTAQITGWDSYEVLNRVHLRYYNFLFPLFFVMAGAAASSATVTVSTWKSVVTVAIMIILCSNAFIAMQSRYLISFIDCPELFGLMYQTWFFKTLLGLTIVSLLIWLFHPRFAARIYVFILLPALMIIGNYHVHKELSQERRWQTDAYDRAGMAARTYLGKTDPVTVIGPERAGLYKVLFYLDNPKATINELPQGMPIEMANIPKNTVWVITIGKYPLLNKPESVIQQEGYQLIHLSNKARS